MSRPFLLTLLGAVLGACAASAPTTEAPPPASAPAPPPPPTMPELPPDPTPTCTAGSHLEGDRCVDDPPPAPPKPPCAAGMALVPGGSYAYGPRKDNAKVEAFCMDATETTAASYEACVKAGKCTDAGMKCAAQATYGVADKAKHPIVCVDFSQAVAYCSYAGKRLPTDEEWEWAARGGSKGSRYPWGDEAPKDQLCWAGNGPQKGTCEAGAFPKGANPQGILDLAGGVFEFTTTKNDDKSLTRIGRGGSWRDGTEGTFRSSRVGGFAKNYRCGFLGIRCVAAPDAAALAASPPPAAPAAPAPAGSAAPASSPKSAASSAAPASSAPKK